MESLLRDVPLPVWGLLLVIALGLLLGGLLGFWLRARRAAVDRAEQSESLEAQRLAKDAAERQRDLAETRLDEYRQFSEQLEVKRKADAAEKDASLREAFAALSGQALKENNAQFLGLAKELMEAQRKQSELTLGSREKAVEGLVKPLKDSLQQVDEQMQALERRRTQAFASIDERIQNLATSEEKLQRETRNLVKALRKPEVRGSWGELQLRQAVEFAGMVEHCDFIEQVSQSSENGTLRPDMIVRMPGGREIIIDAKAPIQAYLDATEAEDTASQEALLEDHARQVSAKVKQLSEKRYWASFEKSPEFVVLFLPNEALYSTALEYDATLLNRGFRDKVILATPTTLVGLLMAVSQGWQQVRMADQARAILDLGQELYDRLATLGGHMGKLGKDLDRGVKTYNQAVSSLESRVLVTARKFEPLAEKCDLEELGPVESTARRLSSPELEASDAETDRDTPSVVAAAGRGS